MSKNITTADSIRNLAAEVKKGFVKKEAFAPSRPLLKRPSSLWM